MRLFASPINRDLCSPDRRTSNASFVSCTLSTQDGFAEVSTDNRYLNDTGPPTQGILPPSYSWNQTASKPDPVTAFLLLTYPSVVAFDVVGFLFRFSMEPRSPGVLPVYQRVDPTAHPFRHRNVSPFYSHKLSEMLIAIQCAASCLWSISSERRSQQCKRYPILL